MLISSQLNTLGDILHNEKVSANKQRSAWFIHNPISQATMEGKGVKSIRSLVGNLQQTNRDVTHESFVAAVVSEFKNSFGFKASQVCQASII
jgi:lipoate-protein ligase A